MTDYLIPRIEQITTDPAGILTGTTFQLRVKLSELRVYVTAPYSGTLRAGASLPWPKP